MIRCKIIGAGSIGNHLAHASRVMGWEVVVCDSSKESLRRMREEIYPSRYQAWDKNIKLYSVEEVPKGGFDLILIGTPPDTHLSLAIEAVNELPKAVLIEKPLCEPSMTGLDDLVINAQSKKVKIFTGYNHAVGRSFNKIRDIIYENRFGKALTVDVEFREHWGGIFNAHPWLEGPHDSYLGFWERGGGASGEHSHAIHLWQTIAHWIQAGKVKEVQASLDYVDDGESNYDQICSINLRSETGLVGRVIQDVVTKPTRKWARIQYSDGFIEWECGKPDGKDTIRWGEGEDFYQEEHEKNRPEDFIEELRHISDTLDSGEYLKSPITLDKGIDAMLVIRAVHKSHKNKTNIII